MFRELGLTAERALLAETKVESGTSSNAQTETCKHWNYRLASTCFSKFDLEAVTAKIVVIFSRHAHASGRQEQDVCSKIQERPSSLVGQ